jgi:hypothetical protein
MEDADISIRLHTSDHLSPPGRTPPAPLYSQSLQNRTSFIPGSNRVDGEVGGAVKDALEREHVQCEASASHALPVNMSSRNIASSEVDRENLKKPERGSARFLARPNKRRRIRHVLYRSNVTSGRRMAQWGPFKSTFLHFKFGLMWYFGCSSAELQRAYDELYTDAYR